MIINRYILTAIISSSLAISGCAGGDIDIVKNSIMDFDKSITVGDAFDNWQACSEKKWEQFETENKRQTVQFTCSLKNVKPFFEKLKNLKSSKTSEQSKNNSALQVDSQKYIFQWSINKDSSTTLKYVGNEMTWADGTFFEGGDDKPLELIKAAYNNEDGYGVATLEGLDNGFGAIAIMAITVPIIMRYNQAQQR